MAWIESELPHVLAPIQILIQLSPCLCLSNYIYNIKMLTNQRTLHNLLRKKDPSNKERQEILKLIRIGRYDLPESVFQSAFNLLKSNSSSDQRFNVTNDLILSGLQLNIGSKIKGYLQKFRKALGDVPYIRKLTNFIDFTASSEPHADQFKEIISEDITNFDLRKQRVSVPKVLYDWDEFVKILNMYLEANPNDVEAWMELGDVYTEKSQYLRALFCYEEIVLLNPENDYYFIRLAELYYTDGGKQNLATAVKYFSYVISRNPHHARALWGLWRALWAQKDHLEDQDKQLMEKVRESLSKLYSQKNPSIKIHLAL